MIPKFLPDKVMVAHKTGSLLGIMHDCGIVYPENREPYILILMAKEVTLPEKVEQGFANISKNIYEMLCNGK